MRRTPLSASSTDIWPEALPLSALTSTSSAAATGGLDWVSSPSDCFFVTVSFFGCLGVFGGLDGVPFW